MYSALQTFWTRTRFHKIRDLIRIQTAWCSDPIPKKVFENVISLRNRQTIKTFKILLYLQRALFNVIIFIIPIIISINLTKFLKIQTNKLLKQGYRYHKFRKTFSKFYRRYFDLISKFQVGLKSLLRQGLSEPDFYGDLVYKLKKIVGSNNFSAQFIKIISHYKKIGYNINVLQQTACLVVNPITVGNFAFLFNCTPVGRTSDSMMVPT